MAALQNPIAFHNTGANMVHEQPLDLLRSGSPEYCKNQLCTSR